MDRFYTWVAYTFATLISWLAGFHDAFYALLFLQTIDIFTGVLYALRTKTFRSAVGKAGIQRRIATWAMILAIGTFQHYTGIFPPPNSPGGLGAAEWAAVGMAFMEFTSIIENAKLLGVSVPSWLLLAMEKAKTTLGLEPREPSDGGK